MYASCIPMKRNESAWEFYTLRWGSNATVFEEQSLSFLPWTFNQGKLAWQLWRKEGMEKHGNIKNLAVILAQMISACQLLPSAVSSYSSLLLDWHHITWSSTWMERVWEWQGNCSFTTTKGVESLYAPIQTRITQNYFNWIRRKGGSACTFSDQVTSRSNDCFYRVFA